MRLHPLPLVLGLALAPLSVLAQEVPAQQQPAPAAVEPQAAPAEPAAAPQTTTVPVAPAPTQEELDYQALYGGQVYDPVADPTLPAPAQMPDIYDPWEKFNRATSMPARISRSTISGLELDGPSVATIFVLRMALLFTRRQPESALDAQPDDGRQDLVAR